MPEPAIEVGKTYKINSIHEDTKALNGLPVKVKKAIYHADEYHDQEVLPMYLVECIDEGSIHWLADIELWADELEAADG